MGGARVCECPVSARAKSYCKVLGFGALVGQRAWVDSAGLSLKTDGVLGASAVLHWCGGHRYQTRWHKTAQDKNSLVSAKRV